MITMRIAPEIIVSNYHDIIKFQTGAVVSIEGTYCSKWGYSLILDLDQHKKNEAHSCILIELIHFLRQMD